MLGKVPRLVNRRVTQKYDQSIGRDSKWGNPIPLNPEMKDRDRDEVIDAYAVWLTHQIMSGTITIDDLLSLEGKVLACWCVPKRCHGHELIKRVKWARNLMNKWERIKK